MFAYDVLADRAPLPEAQLFAYRDSLYGFVGVQLADYAAAAARIISPKRGTVAMPTAEFRRIARPVDAWLGVSEETAPDDRRTVR